MRRRWYDYLWFVLMFVPFVYRNARSSYQTAGIGFGLVGPKATPGFTGGQKIAYSEE